MGAVGKELEPTQRGIAFSTISALEGSVLILIVGAGTADENTGGFSIQALSNLIESLIGKAGVYVFAIGFIAAALSSMLAVPLGAALTAESVFSQCREELDGKEEEEDAATELENKLLDRLPFTPLQLVSLICWLPCRGTKLSSPAIQCTQSMWRELSCGCIIPLRRGQ